MKYAQLVMGPAGTGKSTYCKTIAQHCENTRRSVHVVNLDPAAEYMGYSPSIDIKELITLDDVMDEMSYGPNGGLVYCMEFLSNNLDWLEEKLGDYTDDYLIVDCPGQIELYTHFPVMTRIKEAFQRWNYNLCAVYLIDAQYCDDPSKFMAGTLTALSTMIQLEIPHINVLTKMDLFYANHRRSRANRFLDNDTQAFLADLNRRLHPKFFGLNQALANLLDEYNMVNYLPLDVSDEDSIAYVLSNVDNAMQFGEDEEPKEPKDEEVADEND